jgi:hypothetical protein
MNYIEKTLIIYAIVCLIFGSWYHYDNYKENVILAENLKNFMIYPSPLTVSIITTFIFYMLGVGTIVLVSNFVEDIRS